MGGQSQANSFFTVTELVNLVPILPFCGSPGRVTRRPGHPGRPDAAWSGRDRRTTDSEGELRHMTAGRRRHAASSLPVITGLGAVSCLGDGVPALWAGLLRAEPAPGAAPDDCGLDGRPRVHRLAEDLRAELLGSSPAGAASALALRAAREA